MVDAAETALAAIANPRVYTRARSLVVVSREDAPPLRGASREAGAPFVHQLVPAALREQLARAAQLRNEVIRVDDFPPDLSLSNSERPAARAVA